MIKIELKLKSFEQYYLKKSIVKLNAIKNFFNIQDSEIIFLPKKIKKFTILRSPHIDKKAREQFQIDTFTTKMIVFIPNFKIGCILIETIKKSIFIGVQMEISITNFTYIS